MAVFNRIPEISEAFIGDVGGNVGPPVNVNGDLLRWNGTTEKWERVNESALNSTHNHDDRYFTESEFINVSTGTPDAGKPIKLGAKGRLSGTMRHLRALATKTASYVMSINDEVILADASGGPITITLPPIGPSTGLMYHIKRINDATSDNVTIVGIVN